MSPDYTVGDTLPDAKVTEVLNALGIVSYVESSPCDILADTYSPNYNGWRKGRSICRNLESIEQWFFLNEKSEMG